MAFNAGEDNTATVVRKRGYYRIVDFRARREDVFKALEYNILKRHESKEMQSWKSYPGMSKIVEIARDIFENDNKEDVDILANMMKNHEYQQSAAVVSTIASIVGSKLNTEVAKEIREKIAGIMVWDVPLIKDENDWPQREDEEEDSTVTIVKRGRLDVKSRLNDVSKALEYNILKRHENNEMQSWKSYPGMNKIIEIARDIV